MPVGAGFGVHEKAVEEAKPLRERVMIGRNRLRRAIVPTRGVAIPKYCKRRLAVGSVAVTRRFHVAEHLVVGAILLDDVDHVLDGALAGKKLRRSKIHQAIVLHGLLRIASQGRIVGQRQHVLPVGGERELEQRSTEARGSVDQRKQRARRDVEPCKRSPQHADRLAYEPVLRMLRERRVACEDLLDIAGRLQEPRADVEMIGAQHQNGVVELARHCKRPPR